MSLLVSEAMQSVLHFSPGIQAIHQVIASSTTNRVLDLGSSSAKSFNFFNQLSCKIHFESLNEFFVENDLQGPKLIEALEQYLSPFSAEQKFDVILLWDYLNYLDVAAIHWLMDRLSALCHDNSIIHSLRYTSSQIPAFPGQYEIHSAQNIKVNRPTASARKFPSCNTSTLLKQMPQLFIEQTFINKEGMLPNVAEQTLRYKHSNSLNLKQQAKCHQERRQQTQTTASPTPLNLATFPSKPHKSYALESAIEQLTKPTNVLDLGLKDLDNQAFFESLGAHYVHAESLDKLAQQLEKTERRDSFDLILAWDQINFLETQALQALFSALQPYCHNETILHCIFYAGKEQPKQANHFKLISSGELAVRDTNKTPRQHNLNTSAFLKAAGYFQADKTFVFRAGMQLGISEYLFKARL